MGDPGFIYHIVYSSSRGAIHKVGKSADVRNRLRVHARAHGQFELVGLYYAADMDEAERRAIESMSRCYTLVDEQKERFYCNDISDATGLVATAVGGLPIKLIEVEKYASAKEISLWPIREVDPKTRASIKAYAAQKGLTIAEALKKIVRKAKISK